MSETGKHSSKKHKSKNVLKEYISSIIVFIAISLVIIIPATVVVFPVASRLVHRVEDAYSMDIEDIELNENLADYENGEINYGDRVATLKCSDKGINCSVFYGMNRVSSRNGVGISTSSSAIGQAGNTAISGYDETYLSALKLVEKGDEITITTKNKRYTYKVKSIIKREKGDSTIEELDDKNQLVLYSVSSSFTKDSYRYLYAICDYVGEEVIDNVE